MQAKQQMQRKEVQANKGAIAMLQEFVQCSRSFPLPPNCSALHWTYDPRMASKSALEYRATVAFYLDGVPHHAAGAWHASKKGAQRDAADRALAFFAGRWGVEAMQKRPSRGAPSVPCVCEDDERVYEERLLEEFCAQLPACDGRADLQWSILPESCNDENSDRNIATRCFAVVELHLLGVPHKLAGVAKATERDAIRDTARRALWYLQCPGFEHEFQPEKLISDKGAPGKPLEEVQEMLPPPSGWVSDDSSEEAFEEAQRKTIVMRVQNRLQQEFARQMQPGRSVWEWTYLADPDDEQWPPLFRATVFVPAINREFAGDWVRGQRDAQIETIACVSRYLDELRCSGQEQPKGKRVRRRLDSALSLP
jgi:hypothetical protein